MSRVTLDLPACVCISQTVYKIIRTAATTTVLKTKEDESSTKMADMSFQQIKQAENNNTELEIKLLHQNFKALVLSPPPTPWQVIHSGTHKRTEMVATTTMGTNMQCMGWSAEMFLDFVHNATILLCMRELQAKFVASLFGAILVRMPWLCFSQLLVAIPAKDWTYVYIFDAMFTLLRKYVWKIYAKDFVNWKLCGQRGSSARVQRYHQFALTEHANLAFCTWSIKSFQQQQLRLLKSKSVEHVMCRSRCCKSKVAKKYPW